MKSRKGIIMAGGKGTRLYPATKAISKHLMPIFDKPMIYYPLSTLMLCGIKDILIISTPRDLPIFKELLSDGSQFGINLCYKVQNEPKGIAQAFHISKDFLKGNKSVLILGDNIFHGNSLQLKLSKANKQNKGATIFSYNVKDPSSFAALIFNEKNEIIGIEEKPKYPKTDLAVPGLYFYDEYASEYASTIICSKNGEYGITDLNNIYLRKGNLNVEELRRGFTWIDAGTHQSYLEANQFIYSIENRQGLKISCPEEIAFKKKWISVKDLYNQAKKLSSSSYGNYLMKIVKENK
tara:strand:- start:31422 stop:32303 length:882 start_codon:yes stop_codon:yes gene_type:complete